MLDEYELRNKNLELHTKIEELETALAASKKREEELLLKTASWFDLLNTELRGNHLDHLQVEINGDPRPSILALVDKARSAKDVETLRQASDIRPDRIACLEVKIKAKDAEILGLREALQMIRRYGIKDGMFTGNCPFGCDTPFVAEDALAKFPSASLDAKPTVPDSTHGAKSDTSLAELTARIRREALVNRLKVMAWAFHENNEHDGKFSECGRAVCEENREALSPAPGEKENK